MEKKIIQIFFILIYELEDNRARFLNPALYIINISFLNFNNRCPSRLIVFKLFY